MIALTVDGNQRATERYFRLSGYTFPSARVEPSFFQRHRFSVRREPVGAMRTFLLDRSGNIVFRDFDTDYDELRAEIAELLD